MPSCCAAYGCERVEPETVDRWDTSGPACPLPAQFLPVDHALSPLELLILCCERQVPRECHAGLSYPKPKRASYFPVRIGRTAARVCEDCLSGILSECTGIR